MSHEPTHRSSCCRFRRGRAARSRARPKQLQSKYLYDAFGRACSRRSAGCRGIGSHGPSSGCSRITRRTIVERRSATPTSARSSNSAPAAARRWWSSPKRWRPPAAAARAPDRHLVAGARADRSGRSARLRHFSVVGHRETYEVGLRQAAESASRQPDAGAAAGIQHRQLRYAGAPTLPPAHPGRARAWRPCCSAPIS